MHSDLKRLDDMHTQFRFLQSFLSFYFLSAYSFCPSSQSPFSSTNRDRTALFQPHFSPNDLSAGYHVHHLSKTNRNEKVVIVDSFPSPVDIFVRVFTTCCSWWWDSRWGCKSIPKQLFLVQHTLPFLCFTLSDTTISFFTARLLSIVEESVDTNILHHILLGVIKFYSFFLHLYIDLLMLDIEKLGQKLTHFTLNMPST